MRDVAREPDAARAEDAALGVQHDARAEIHGLGLVDLGLHKPAGALAVINRVLLQLAFAGLVADRAIERVIDEQRFEHALAHLLHAGRLGVNLQARRNGRGAGDGRARRLGDFGRAVRVQHRLAVGAERRGAKFHQAHAAVAGDGQLGMPAIMRHLHLGQLAGLDHGRGRELARPVGGEPRHFDFAAIHLHLDFFNRRRGGLGFSCGCC
jgi:hypothetical protein